MEKGTTVKDLTIITGIPERTVHNAIDRVFPDLKKNGVKTELSKIEVMLIMEELKKPHNSELASSGKVINTDLEMEKKAMEVMAWMGQKIKTMQEQLLEAQPKIELYDIAMQSETGIDMGSVSQVLSLGYGRNTLFKKLRDIKVLKSDNIPYQEYIDRGYFKVIEEPYQVHGASFIGLKTLVMQKGLEYIVKAVGK